MVFAGGGGVRMTKMNKRGGGEMFTGGPRPSKLFRIHRDHPQQFEKGKLPTSPIRNLFESEILFLRIVAQPCTFLFVRIFSES